MPVLLTKHIRSLRGGSQPHLMQANDGHIYVVKFQGNPRGTHVLANELLAARLAEASGLPVPAAVVVELPLDLSEELYFETPNGREPIRPGLHLGSPLVVTNLEGRSYDSLPHSFQHLLRHPEYLIGIQLFDLWTGNRDTRQFVFWKYSKDKKYNVACIDNGHCFGGPEWNFGPLSFPNGSFTEPSAAEAWLRWAERIATFPIRDFERAQSGLIPPEWDCGVSCLTVIFGELLFRQAIIAAEIAHRLDRFSVGDLNTCKLKWMMHRPAPIVPDPQGLSTT